MKIPNFEIIQIS